MRQEFDYFKSRDGLGDLYHELSRRSCKIAYLGNSITAQKEGYKKYLSDYIDQAFNQKNSYINAGIGGIGSLATNFLMDDFVLRYRPDICFVECTAADLGAATPEEFIPSAVEGIIQKLITNNVKVCFLHLYREMPDEAKNERILSLYEKIVDHYQIPSINIGRAISFLIKKNEYKNEDIVYDGIHTTPDGAQLYAMYIFSSFKEILKIEAQEKKDLSYIHNPFIHTRIVTPESSMLEDQKCYIKKKFRGIINYLQLQEENLMHYSTQEGIILGLFIVADEESGVIMIENQGKAIKIQTYDKWCDKERIQAVIFGELIIASTEVQIGISTSEVAKKGSNGTENTIKKKGTSLKVIGLMVVLDNEPEIKSRLW
jgi:lysophospholipase L1-like esterase